MLKFLIILFSFFTLSAYAGNYRIINEDHLLDADKVTISFSQRIDKSEGEVTFRTCENCTWQTRPFNLATDLYIKEGKVRFNTFKKTVMQEKRSNSIKEKLVLISIDTRVGKNGVFSLHWNYQEH